MAAPRTYSDAQRQAVFRLHEAGLTSPAIAAACAEGRSGLARFKIPDRTVREIVREMREAADRNLPTTVAQLESVEAMERAPARAARLVDAEIDRLENKARKGKALTDDELDRLPKLARFSNQIRGMLQGQRKAKAQPRRTGKSATTTLQGDAFWENLAREEREKAEREGQLTDAHPCRDSAESTTQAADDEAERAPEAPASSDAHPTPKPAPDNGIVATPAEVEDPGQARQIAAKRAAEALAGYR